MTDASAITLEINNVVPHADAKASQEILSVWRSSEEFCKDIPFICLQPSSNKIANLNLSLDLKDIIALFEHVIAKESSFDQYREANARDQSNSLGARIQISFSSIDGLKNEDLYYIASVALQQFFLSMNLCYPGACKLIGSSFTGDCAHLYEAQSFDSKLFYDARMSAHQNNWPVLQDPTFENCWSWINAQDFTESDIAISDINKVLVDLLKLGQQRHRFGSRSVLLATQQLDLLLGSRHAHCTKRLRDRCKLVLGKIPESADCFIELYQLRDNLFEGTHPVRRPALVSHDAKEEKREQIASHNHAVEMAAAIVVALLQDLIVKNQSKYTFQENLA